MVTRLRLAQATQTGHFNVGATIDLVWQGSSSLKATNLPAIIDLYAWSSLVTSAPLDALYAWTARAKSKEKQRKAKKSKEDTQ